MSEQRAAEERTQLILKIFLFLNYLYANGIYCVEG